MNLLKKFYYWLFNIETKKLSEVYPLHPEDIRKDKQLKALAQEKSSLEGQLAEIIAEQKQKKELSKDEEKDEELLNKLAEQEERIKSKKFGKSFSFTKFFKKVLSNKEFREELEIADKDDEVVFGKFGDIVTLEGGHIGITDRKGNLLVMGRTLSQVIYKPDSLPNQLKRKRLLLPLDKNGNFIPDLENLELPEIVWDEGEQGYTEAKERVRLVKEMLIEREEEIRGMKRYTERLEHANINLKRSNDDLKRANSLLVNSSDTSQTELSKAMERSMQYERKMGEMQMQIIKLTESKALQEMLVTKLENINKDLLDKIEVFGAKTHFEKTMTDVKALLEWAKANIPEIHIQKEEEPRREAVFPQTQQQR